MLKPQHSARCLTRCFFCAVLVSIAPGCLSAAVATASLAAVDAAQPWRTVIAHVQDGDLSAARDALSRFGTSSRKERQWRELLESGIEQREQLSRSLATRATQAVAQRQISQAMRQIDLAQRLDRGTLASPAYAAVLEAQQRRDAALHAVEKCAMERAVGCLREALAKVRTIDRDSPRALQLELAAHDWFQDLPQNNRSPSREPALR